MANLLSELKRRNVVKVATIYVVASWLLLQVADIIFPVFDIPNWASRLVVVLLGIGFPVAMIMAWAFNLTPEGIEWDSAVGEHHVHTHVWDWIVGVLLVVAIGLIVKIEIRHWQESGEQSATNAVTTVDRAATAGFDPPKLSIAVLPFVNMSGDPDNEYFADGMSEEILNLLARIPGLKVIGRTSSFVYKGKNEDLRVIGKTLGVSTLLEGSVRRSGDRVRITAQLINAKDATRIWSETYDRTMTDIFDVQDDVAAAIIDRMEILVVENPTRRRPTESLEAYAVFLKARIAQNNYDWRTGEALLHETTGIDPEFAEAYELLAYGYWSMGGTEYEAEVAQKLTAEAAAQALAIDPDLVFAKALFRFSDIENYSMLEKVEAFEIAARERPDDERILDIYWYNLFLAGYLTEAMAVAERRLNIDPLSLRANGRMPLALFSTGRIDAGFAALDMFVQMDRDHNYWFVGEANLAYRRDQIAIRNFEDNLEEGGSRDISWVAELVTYGRDPLTGQAYLDRRIPEIVDSVPGEFSQALQRDLSYWYLYFGHLDRYFDLILKLGPDESTWSDVDDLIATATGYPDLGFTAHPKYERVAEMLGLFAVWDERGPPDFCKKRDSQWICD